MKISVIVPVYNCEDFLPACIESLLKQTYQNLQIILIDDGAKDRSGAICDRYAEKDTRICVLHQENQGVSVARNAGLDIAEGDLITFVDSDDAVEPDMYEVLVKLLLEHDADIAHCGYKKIHFDGSTKDILGTGVLLVQDTWQASECLLAGEHFTGGPWAKLYRKDLFSDLRFDPELKINEDVWMNAQAFRKARKLVFLDVPKYCYYERTQSATRMTNWMKVRQDCVEVSERMLSMYLHTALEGICADRLYYALLNLYRECLLRDYSGQKELRKNVHSRIKAISEMSVHICRRSVWNYRFMRYLPRLYVVVYQIFDRLRVPNIDL